MLTVVTSLGRNGLQDWLLQRISAIILALYVMFIFSVWMLQPTTNIIMWQHLFTSITVKYFTLLALLALIIHAWIGIWTVTTDYLKPTWLRLNVQILVYIALLFYFVMGIQILWGQ